jgi:copper oxidase (laccase) domain-containing protein
MNERLEFDLHQGWSRGLRLTFENASSSSGFNTKVALHVDQHHGDEIHSITESDLSKISPIARADGMLIQGDFYKSCKRPLLIKTADCIPLFLVDRESQALAAIHAGWRGLAKGIHTKLFRQGHMNPKTTWAWVGPSMSGEGFEVREDMWSQLPPQSQRDESIFSAGQNSDARIFHAWRFLEEELKSLGVVLVYNVEINTFANPRISFLSAKLPGGHKARRT